MAWTHSMLPGKALFNYCVKAAGAAEANSRKALDVAQKLSEQLRAAEEQIYELEAEAEAYRQKSERAEQWLHRVYTDIEERFLQNADSRRAR